MFNTAPFSAKREICLVIGSSNCPPPERYHDYLENISYIACADGGSRHARELGLSPDLIIGDMDSISGEDLEYFRACGTEIKRIFSQEENDLEKTLRHLIGRKHHRFLLIGSMGRREDHSLATLQIMKKYSRKAEILTITATSEIFILRNGSYRIRSSPGETISLFGFPTAWDVRTEGLAFPLQGETLATGSRGISNIVRFDEIEIAFRKGTILVIRVKVQ